MLPGVPNGLRGQDWGSCWVWLLWHAGAPPFRVFPPAAQTGRRPRRPRSPLSPTSRGPTGTGTLLSQQERTAGAGCEPETQQTHQLGLGVTQEVTAPPPPSPQCRCPLGASGGEGAGLPCWGRAEPQEIPLKAPFPPKGRFGVQFRFYSNCGVSRKPCGGSHFCRFCQNTFLWVSPLSPGALPCERPRGGRAPPPPPGPGAAGVFLWRLPASGSGAPASPLPAQPPSAPPGRLKVPAHPSFHVRWAQLGTVPAPIQGPQPTGNGPLCPRAGAGVTPGGGQRSGSRRL